MRYHPLTIAFRLYNLVKGNIIIFILFLINWGSDSWLWKYGAYLYFPILFIALLQIFIDWFVEKYEWKDNTFHIYKGIFVKKSSAIPFSRIQNVTRKTTVFHKIFGLTSLTFETAMDGEDDAIHFEVLTKDHANFLIDLVQPGKQNTEQRLGDAGEERMDVGEDYAEKDVEGEFESRQEHEPVQQLNQNLTNESYRTVHFKPERKDLWKASFTSLSFLAIIPIGIGLLQNVDSLLPDTEQVEGFFRGLLTHNWLLFILIILLVIIAVTFGISRTFIRYGKYEISSDHRYIYIDRGVLDESYFTIEKKKIQGLEMEQTFLKRLFGLAEVKLISSANPNQIDEKVNVNSLYPFLPIEQAYQLIEQLLPQYQLNNELKRLPRRSLLVKLLRPSWIWIIATIALVYFKPDFFNIEQMWWILSLVLLFLIVLQRILDYIHTKYVVTEDQIQWWHGGLTSRMFITKRKKVIEMSYSQSRLQHFFQVASITTINRSTPAHIETINDIPVPTAQSIKNWYLKRKADIQLE